MKAILIIFFLCMCKLSYSQFTITNQQMIHPGDTIYESMLDTTNFDPGNSGLNALWDYSGISVLTYNSLATVYSNSTCLNANSDTGNLSASFIPGINSSICYFSDSSQFSLIGSSSSDIQSHYFSTTSYSDRKSLFLLPLTYLNSFSDSSKAYRFTNPGSASSYSTGFINKYYDGFGELRLPWRIYYNVARVKVVTYERDSTHYAAGPISIEIYTVNGYEWYDINTHDYILAYYETTNSNLDVIKRIYTKSGYTLGVNELPNQEKSLKSYPNPSIGKFNIEIPEQFKNEKYLELIIYNEFGKCIYKREFDSVRDKINVDLESMAKGIYCISLKNQKVVYTGRIIIN